MGWPGPRRRTVPLKLNEAEEAPVQAVADTEHGGNLSAAIRALLAEALTGTRNTMTEKHPEDLTVADGVPFAAHMIVGAIKFVDGHRARCGKSYDLEGVQQDLVAALTSLRPAARATQPADQGE